MKKNLSLFSMENIKLYIFAENIIEVIEENELKDLIKKKDILKYNKIEFNYMKKKYIISKMGENNYHINVELGKDLYFKKFGNVKIDDLKSNKDHYYHKFQEVKNKERIIPEYIIDFFKESKINISN